MDIGVWLRDLGLEQYEPSFRENKIDSDILSKLTVEDLKDLGVILVGDRRRLLEAIASLRAEIVTNLAMAPRSLGVPTSGVEPSHLFGERHHLTVLFCDLVGSTEIAGRLDAEEWRDIVSDCHRAINSAVTRFGGRVAKNLGDGALVYFGYPLAQENDAERAVRGGLAIVDAITRACFDRSESAGFPSAFGWESLSTLIRPGETEQCREPTLLISGVG